MTFFNRVNHSLHVVDVSPSMPEPSIDVAGLGHRFIQETVTRAPLPAVARAGGPMLPDETMTVAM